MTLREKMGRQVWSDRSCKECGKSLLTYQKVYCSHKCQWQFTTGAYIDRWLAGQEAGPNANGILKNTCRRYMVEQAGHRCQSPTCAVPGGWSVPNPVTGKVILTVDHIDGNWKNNAVDNLIVLCYSCHTLTPTFGSLNKKSAGMRGSGNRAYKEHSVARMAQERNDPVL